MRFRRTNSNVAIQLFNEFNELALRFRNAVSTAVLALPGVPQGFHLAPLLLTSS